MSGQRVHEASSSRACAWQSGSCQAVCWPLGLRAGILLVRAWHCRGSLLHSVKNAQREANSSKVCYTCRSLESIPAFRMLPAPQEGVPSSSLVLATLDALAFDASAQTRWPRVRVLWEMQMGHIPGRVWEAATGPLVKLIAGGHASMSACTAQARAGRPHPVRQQVHFRSQPHQLVNHHEIDAGLQHCKCTGQIVCCKHTPCLCWCSPSTPTFGGGGGSLFKDGSITSSLQAAKEAAAAEQEAAEENGKEQEQVACMTDAPFWVPRAHPAGVK